MSETRKQRGAKDVLSLPLSSEDREFSSVETALAWLTMQGKSHPRLFLVGLLLRSGMSELTERLERDLYPSNTAATEEYHFVCLSWEDQPFVVMSVPMLDEDRVRTLLERVEPGFRLGNGEPHIAEVEPGLFTLTAWREGNPTDQQKANITGFTNAKCFPLTGENVFTIEYLRRERGPFVAGVMTGGDGKPPRFQSAFRPMDTSAGRRRR